MTNENDDNTDNDGHYNLTTMTTSDNDDDENVATQMTSQNCNRTEDLHSPAQSPATTGVNPRNSGSPATTGVNPRNSGFNNMTPVQCIPQNPERPKHPYPRIPGRPRF